MRRLPALLFAALALAGPPAAAGIVRSAGADAVAITIYRDPGRGDQAMDRRWPGGYALITETRRLTLPAGESVIRFEDVADGLLPESAILTGLPIGVREKNRDARLLSPGALVDAYLKRRVTLIRTDRATGKTRRYEAVIQSGPGDGVLIETGDGVEALRCSGLPERLSYDDVPAGLTARPTFSVAVRNDQPRHVTLQLSYLAEGFDWDAHYIAQRPAEGGRSLSLFGWASLANGGTTRFERAQLQLVAGQVNRGGNRQAPPSPAMPLRLSCWPMDITSTHPANAAYPPPPLASPAMMVMDTPAEIVISGSRLARMAMKMAPVAAMTAEQEQLGDLKLYRVPEPVTVAAQSQKQVAMIVQPRVEITPLYTAQAGEATGGPQPLTLVLRARNLARQGLGVPLPAGGVALFEPVGGHSLLAGETRLDDKAVGDEVELRVGASSAVRWTATRWRDSRTRQDWRLTVTNARAHPVAVEIALPQALARLPAGVRRRHGVPRWAVIVPAGGTARLDYSMPPRGVERFPVR